MLIGISKRADVAHGRLIIHYHRFVFRKLHSISLPSHFLLFLLVRCPSLPRRTTPGGNGDGTLLHCGYCTHKALVSVESRRNDVTGLGL